MSALAIAAILVASLSIQGCGTLSPQGDLETTTSAMAGNGQINHWQLRGKIGLKQHNKAHSAYLNWRQCGDHFDIRLTGPLGQGAAHLYGDHNRVTLERGKLPSISAESAEQLLQQELGWVIPVSQLLYWIRGVPQPEVPFRAIDEHAGFTQSGWQLSYPKIKTVEGYSLPVKAIAKQQTLSVTLLLKRWELHPVCESSL